MKTIFSSRRYHYVARVSIFLIMVALIAGMVRCTAEVTALPVIKYFTADLESISAGESSMLSWDVSGATAVIINPDIGPDIGSVDPTGTLTVSPTTTTTYTLKASNEEGSSTATVQVTVSAPSLPDLTITTGNPTVTPPTAAPGETVSLSAWTVKNQGNADSGSFDNGFYLSTDSVITASDTYLDGNSNSNLAPGSQFDWDGPTLTIPSGTLSGNYYIGILVDRTNEVSESDENNNYVASPITVSAPSLPDLTITTGNPTVTPPTAAPGGTVSLSAWTIKNQGNADSGSFDNGFYLSTDSVITASDTYLDGNSNSNLAPGGQYNWGGPTLTIPSGTPLGNYYIGILVDRTNEVSESDEDNNYVASPITVSAPSFAVTKVQCKSYSASGTRTCPFTISYTFDITTNGAGTVSYHFERSDGYLSAATTLSFTGASTKTVSYSWTVGASGSYAVLCRTTAPNEMSDDSPPVAVTCSFAVTKVQAASYPASGTRTCPFTMNFGFDITTNGAGTVSYHFERSDGATSPTYTVSFTGTSTKRVSYSWTVVASGSYKVTCRTLAPNEMSSASPPITVTCS